MRFSYHGALPVERLVCAPRRQVARWYEQVIVIENIAPVNAVILRYFVIHAAQVLIAVFRTT
jgi:hypothetical protein